MSQTELATGAGIAPGQVSRYEQGKNIPRPHIQARLAQVLGVSATWLASGEGSRDLPTSPEPQAILNPDYSITSTPEGAVTLSVEVDEQMAADLERGAKQLGISIEDFFKGVVLEGLARKMEERKMPRADIEAIAREVKALLDQEKK